MLKIGGHMTTTTFLSKESKVLQHYKNEPELISKQMALDSGRRKTQAVIPTHDLRSPNPS